MTKVLVILLVLYIVGGANLSRLTKIARRAVSSTIDEMENDSKKGGK
jgi:hypothetical protein